MQSLEVTACLRLVQDKSLQEIIEFTNRKRGGLPGQICDSPQFWQKVIDRFYGKSLLVQRQDVHPRECRKFAKSLANGEHTFYQTMINLATPETKVFDPEEVDQLEDDSLLEDVDDFPLTEKLLGWKPKPGTAGYVVDYTFESDQGLIERFGKYFLVESFEQLEEAEFNFKYFCGNMAYDHLVVGNPEAELLVFADPNIPHLAVQNDTPQFRELFLKSFLSQSLQEDSDRVTEFHIQLQPGELALRVQVWIAQVTF
jgi:hypothetical protein